jgi:hypothetical protein
MKYFETYSLAKNNKHSNYKSILKIIVKSTWIYLLYILRILIFRYLIRKSIILVQSR